MYCTVLWIDSSSDVTRVRLRPPVTVPAWRSLLPLEWQEFPPRTHAAKPIFYHDLCSGKINLVYNDSEQQKIVSACCIILVAGLSHSSVLVCVVLSTTLTSLLTHLSLTPDTY